MQKVMNHVNHDIESEEAFGRFVIPCGDIGRKTLEIGFDLLIAEADKQKQAEMKWNAMDLDSEREQGIAEQSAADLDSEQGIAEQVREVAKHTAKSKRALLLWLNENAILLYGVRGWANELAFSRSPKMIVTFRCGDQFVPDDTGLKVEVCWNRAVSRFQ